MPLTRPIKTRQLTAVDLFCGAGGLSQGMVEAGVRPVAAYDNWAGAVAVYNRNLESHAETADLSDVGLAADKIKELKPDLIAGGPPCQDFSSAGKRTENLNASLTVKFAQIVAQCRPAMAVMENVPLVSRSAAYRQMRNILQDYHQTEIVLDANLCGAAQKRKRMFWIGTLTGISTFQEWAADNQTEHRPTVREHLPQIDTDHYYRHPRSYARRGIFSVDEPSPTIRGVNRPIPEGYQQHRLDTASPGQARPLTSEERSLLQTFPHGWDWQDAGGKTAQEQMIGNAVPPCLARFVVEGLLATISF